MEVPRSTREVLVPILERSFEGIYLWHAKRTLRSIEVVRAVRAAPGEEYAGMIMLKRLAEGVGYVYYVAVAPDQRGRGIGGRLLDDALSHFAAEGVEYVYASVEEENSGSNALFASRGFERVGPSEMSERYGRVRAFIMQREMMVVQGEVVLRRRLEGGTAR